MPVVRASKPRVEVLESPGPAVLGPEAAVQGLDAHPAVLRPPLEQRQEPVHLRESNRGVSCAR